MTQWYADPITHPYTTDYQGPGTDTPHFADDIGTPFHTPLTSPLAGTVKTADYQAWGGEIFIQPDQPGLPEFYLYHPDEVDVSVGQHVNPGDFLGLSGGENPGYPGAEHPAQPQWSTGPHTHVGWFSDWYTVPEDGETIPQGPDITPFLQQLAQSGGQATPDASQLSFNSSQFGQQSSTPAQQCNWWDIACQARNVIGAVGTQLNPTQGILTFVQDTAGGFLMRVGVGILGIGLMSFGTLEIIGALKGESGTEVVQQEMPGKQSGGGQPAPKKSSEEKGGKEEAQPKEASESEGAEAGEAGEAGEAAEMAAVAA